MSDEGTTSEGSQEDFEMILLAALIIVSILLGYKNRDKIKAWCNDFTGKFK